MVSEEMKAFCHQMMGCQSLRWSGNCRDLTSTWISWITLVRQYLAPLFDEEDATHHQPDDQ